MKANIFHQILLQSIRDEFEHNMSQQLYISDEAWDTISIAREELISIINQSAAKLEKDAQATTLAKTIMEMYIQEKTHHLSDASAFLKDEFRRFLS